ncbi:hypothetical protein SDC9_92425 [bioreactor metagenome]|uniref:DUF4190 domain-containing protein n=1 Tax=bioreactor metagenome TaxID=1076179 RepID=A0A645A7L2_9ZZZZ
MTIPENSNPVEWQQAPLSPKQDSSLAIASLISGLVGWTFIPVLGAIVAVILGHLAKKEIRDSGGRLSGDGMALAGLILGYVQIGLLVLGTICVLAFAFAVAAGITSNVSGVTTYLLSVI